MWQALELNGSIRPYLTFSVGAHGALVVALAVLLPNGMRRPEKIYHISFIGDTPAIINRERGARPKAARKKAPPRKAKAAPPKVRPQKDPDAFNLKPPSGPLPRPSFLPSAPAPKPAKKEAVEAPPAPEPVEAAPAAEEGAGEGSGEASVVVTADMSDFPHPWYLTRLRSSIWDAWSKRMPSEPIELGVRFTIMRDGRVVDIRVEYTSGDQGYDYAAVSAIQESAPMPPLPAGFKDRFLRVHFQFKVR